MRSYKKNVLLQSNSFKMKISIVFQPEQSLITVCFNSPYMAIFTTLDSFANNTTYNDQDS